jgi:DNA-directed RNA polymerase subunit M/transcription elongation factor TFIIS
MPKSRNQAGQQIKNKQVKNKENKKKEVQGAPIIEEKYKELLVRIVMTDQEDPIGKNGEAYWNPYKDLTKYWVEIMELRNRGKDKYGYIVVAIRCPICKKKARWNHKTETFECKHNGKTKMFEYFKRKTMQTVYTSGGVSKRITHIYDNNTIARGKVENKQTEAELKEQKRREYNKGVPYHCGFSYHCKFKCGSYKRLLEHYKDKHSFIPWKTVRMEAKQKDISADIIEYVILKNCQRLITTIKCPTCKKDARLNLETERYECDCGRSMNAIVRKGNDSVKMIPYLLRKSKAKTVYDLVKDARCSHCGAKIITTKDKKHVYCSRRYGCPLTKERLYRNIYGMTEDEFKSLPKEKQRELQKEAQRKKKERELTGNKPIEQKASGNTLAAIIEMKKRSLSLEPGTYYEQLTGEQLKKRTHKTKITVEKDRTTIKISEIPLEKTKNREISISEGDPMKHLTDEIERGFGKKKEDKKKESRTIKCPYCKRSNVITTSAQVRSSDEPESEFYTCLDCGKKWAKLK